MTGSDDNRGTVDEKAYWKTSAFFPILDTIIFNVKRRFSDESLQMAKSIDNLLKMNFEESSFIIDHKVMYLKYYIMNNISIILKYNEYL